MKTPLPPSVATPAAFVASSSVSRKEPRATVRWLAIHLHYLEHDPVDAAMRTLGLSRSGFYKLLGRARASLADLLRDFAPEDNR